MRGNDFEQEPGAWNVVEQPDGRYLAQQGERQIALTYGQLITDTEWGLAYNLNDASISRATKKRYVVERARFALQEALDEQIFAVEMVRGTTGLNLHRAYENAKHDRESTQMHMGIIAERMVRTYLERLSWDYPDLDFTIERADAQQDIEKKIDFIIHRRSRSRGVHVEPAEGPRDAGIQFTTREDAEGIARKRAQVDRAKRYAKEVDDVVLVNIPMEKFSHAYVAWRSKQTPGGPERYWNQDTKDDIFRNLMQGILPPEEVEREVQVLHTKEAA